MLATATQPVEPSSRRVRNAEGHRRQCTARLSNGTRRCHKWAVKGSNVCPHHGGSAPQVKLSARQRLDAMVEPAMAIVEKGLAKIANTPGMEVSGTAIRLATEILDRAGYPRASKVELTQVEAKRLDVYTDAVVGILRRSCQLAGLDLKSEKVRAAVGQATKEWAEKQAKET